MPTEFHSGINTRSRLSATPAFTPKERGTKNSKALEVRIPTEGGRRFQRKADTDSDGSRTMIPIDPGQP